MKIVMQMHTETYIELYMHMYVGMYLMYKQYNSGLCMFIQLLTKVQQCQSENSYGYTACMNTDMAQENEETTSTASKVKTTN